MIISTCMQVPAVGPQSDTMPVLVDPMQTIYSTRMSSVSCEQSQSLRRTCLIQLGSTTFTPLKTSGFSGLFKTKPRHHAVHDGLTAETGHLTVPVITVHAVYHEQD